MFKYCCLFITLLFGIPGTSYAAGDNENVEKQDTVSFKERIGVHTNTLGWLLMTPNIGVEYDIVHTPYKKVSLLVSGRYNWNSNESSSPRYVYNIAGAKAELRWYFRTRSYQREFTGINSETGQDEYWEWERELEQSKGFFNRLFSSRTYTARTNPRSHRAYYIGPYVGYDKVTLKLGSTGKQGSAIGAGVTFGYTAPLYIYDNGTAIDFELGASVGALNVEYDKFGYNSDDRCYTNEGKEDSKFLPYPVVSDLRLSLVYRFDPIKNQIVAVNTEKLEKEKEMYKLKLNYEDKFDDIWSYDELPEGYNGRYARYKASLAKYTDATRRYNDSIERTKLAVSEYKDSVADAHYKRLARMNSEINSKNQRIKRINKQILEHENGDSSLLLEQLRPAYEYAEVPKKLLNKGSERTIPNTAEIKTVADMNIPLLNSLVERYAEIEDGEGVVSVEKRLVAEYESTREKMLLSNNDSVSPISYYELLLSAIPNINSFCIKAHNDKYVTGGDAAEPTDEVNSRSYSIGGGKALPLLFLEKNEPIYLKEKRTLSISSMNDEIEAANIVKLAKAEQTLGVKLDKKNDTDSDKKKTKKSKSKKENKKTEDKED